MRLDSDRAKWIAYWVLPLEPELRAWLRPRVSGTTLDADDVVHEIYAVLSGLASVQHIHSPRGYVFQVAQSMLLAHYRRRRIVPIDYLADIDSVEFAADAPSPEDEVSGRRELRQLLALVAELPSRQREAFELLKIRGLTQREAASAMAVSESTLEKHIAKALLFLMKRLERGGLSRARASSVQANDELERGEPVESQQLD